MKTIAIACKTLAEEELWLKEDTAAHEDHAERV